VRELFSEELFPGQSVMLEMIDRLTEEIRRMDREAERLVSAIRGEIPPFRERSRRAYLAVPRQQLIQ